MFKKNKIMGIVLITMLVISSCYKDKGNYDYSPINEISITQGFDKEYYRYIGQKLQIKPKFKFTKDNKKYTYKWVLSERTHVFEVSKDKDLDIIIDSKYEYSNYKISYVVTDVKTGVEWHFKSKLHRLNVIAEGWLVLNDIEGGKPRLDMISFMHDELYNVKHNILKFKESPLELKGSAGFVQCFPYTAYQYGIYVSTSEKTTRLSPDNFDWRSVYDITNVMDPSGSNHVDYIYPKASASSYAVMKTDVLYKKGRDYKAVNTVNGTTFEAAPYIALGKKEEESILFDITNKRFVQNNGDECTVMESPTSPLFDYNIGLDLVYMESNDYVLSSKTGKAVFAILKDANKNYLAFFNSSTRDQYYYEEILATDFNNASHYAISPEFGYIFYTVENKVYQYDFSSKTTKKMLDKGTEKITLLKFHNFMKDEARNNLLQNKLMICSYASDKPAKSCGLLELYTVPSVNEPIVLYKSYDGFGKIKSVAYRERGN